MKKKIKYLVKRIEKLEELAGLRKDAKIYMTTVTHPNIKAGIIFYYTSDEENDHLINKLGTIELYDWLLDVEKGYLKEL